MPAIVPNSEFLATGGLPQRPSDGDDAFLDGGLHPLWPVFQAAFNRSELLKDGLVGMALGQPTLRVAPGGTAAVFSVRTGDVQLVLADATGAVKIFAPAIVNLDATAIEGGGVLANSAWYYVYAFNNAGTLAYQLSTTAPDVSVQHKDAAPRYVLLGCFPTNGAGAPLPVLRAGRVSVYDIDTLASGGILRVVNAASAGIWTAVACGAVVPAHARVARLYCECNPVLAPGDSLQLRRAGATTFAKNFRAQAAQPFSCEMAQVLSSGQQFEYQTAGLTPAIYVTGWEE